MLQVVSADFVPIVPYLTHSINVAIGQRYDIVVNASEYSNPEKSFWIRAQVATNGSGGANCADGVFSGIQGLAEKTGIVRYDSSDTKDPISLPWSNLSPMSVDETPLVPTFPCFNGKASNGRGMGKEFGIKQSPDSGVNDPKYI